MSLSDLFCVERNKKHFLNLVEAKLDITFANEQEIMSLINAKKIEDWRYEQALQRTKELRPDLLD